MRSTTGSSETRQAASRPTQNSLIAGISLTPESIMNNLEVAQHNSNNKQINMMATIPRNKWLLKQSLHDTDLFANSIQVIQYRFFSSIFYEYCDRKLRSCRETGDNYSTWCNFVRQIRILPYTDHSELLPVIVGICIKVSDGTSISDVSTSGAAVKKYQKVSSLFRVYTSIENKFPDFFRQICNKKPKTYYHQLI